MLVFFGAIAVAAFLHFENEFLLSLSSSDQIKDGLTTGTLNDMVSVQLILTLGAQVTQFFIRILRRKDEEIPTLNIVTLGKMLG
ncbi:MAG: hypothetical protein LC102_00185 [Ignavibacteriales bacterium]|nr:hypothetical protein [Ignavibacteriaceae bacterium]MCZ2141830.1 hypothetical protein [Ignavibacteriales bacterium]OQY77627.1 MAG: hypothetical protein B6D45_02545 [Ignavibacteriales bacterium UTCHB3]